MQKQYHFHKLSSTEGLTDLKNKWLTSLSSPQDGMWESLRNSATHWGISYGEKMIGYACINDKEQLIQFYVSPEYLQNGTTIFKQLIQTTNIKNGIVGTNNPIYLSMALHFVKKLEINTYLFRSNFEVSINEKDGDLRECLPEDIEQIVEFCHYSTGATKEWLSGYISELIEKREVFVFESGEEIIGICEVRKSVTSTPFADIGMIVSPDYRRKGYGTYLLNKAKAIALEGGKIPICSCEKDNIASLKSIHNCGFVSTHQLLSIVFK